MSGELRFLFSHKLKLTVLIVCLLTLLVSTPVAKAAEIVSFPDPNLEAAIREAIGKPTGDIYVTDLEGLTYLDAYERDITDLTGLEYCIDLTDLDLGRNQISDLSPLSDLTNLENVNFYGNQISDLSPLSGLTGLTILDLSDNQISNLSPLSGLTGLTLLALSQNQISDLTPLSDLIGLTVLFLWSNQISDVSPLSGLTGLTFLELGINQISDLSPLSDLANLEELFLDGNQISDIEPLVDNAGLSSGDTVDLCDNPLSITSINDYIPQLEARGVYVLYDTSTNQYPIADAGPNQEVTDTDEDGFEDITLDGSSSYDLDGTIESYEWKEGDTVLSTEASFTHSFSVGTHIITLTVTDNEGATDSDWLFVTVKKEGGCFIATAAYGTPMAEEIDILRDFRDEFLLTNPVGEALVELYYNTSPPVAEFIAEHPTLKQVVRSGLEPVIAMSTVAVNTTLAQKIAIVSSMVLLSALLVVWLRKRTGKAIGKAN